MKKKFVIKNTFILIIFLLAAPLLQAQDDSFKAAALDESLDLSRAVYVIRGLDFDINGRTRPFALIYKGEFREGEKIQGKAKLEKYIAGKEQLLMNQRVLEDVAIEYTLDKAESDGSLPVNLLIHVKDTWNFIVLPYPQYDSNDGLQLTLKIRHYNFLGTMSPLRIDLGYQNDTDNNHSFSFMVETDTPFRAAGFIWHFKFDHDLSFTVGDPLYYRNVTGLSIELPAKNVLTTLGINQYLVINETNSDHDMDKYDLDDEIFSGPYASSEIYSSFKIPLPLVVGNYGGLSYTPRVSGKISYTKGGVDEPRRPAGILSQTLGFGKVNWTGNYRKGLEASLENYNSLFAMPYDWNIEIHGNAAFYHYFNKYLGFSTRLQYRQNFNDIYYDSAETLRGIINNRLRAEYLLSLNMDLPFRILRFYPSELFNNHKLRYFNFELHTSPFFDFAMAKGTHKQSGSRDDPYEEISFRFDEALYGAGMELIVFPAFMRSLYLRLSVGYDLRGISGFRDILNWDEIFIGIGHHY